jgi:hypothetical protein
MDSSAQLLCRAHFPVNDATTSSSPRRPAGWRTPRNTPALALSLGLAIFTAPGGAPEAADAPAAAPVASSDVDITNYAFASELGSGIYEIDGRTIQVYQIGLAFPLRPVKPHRLPPGIDLLIPVTFGFFNFQSTDLLHLDIPTHIGAVSLEPGVQLDYWMSDVWHLYPYAKAGTSFATSAQVNAVIYGFGLRSDYTFEQLRGDGLWRAELAYAGVNYLANVPNDSFVRLRDGAELRRNVGWSLGSHAVQLAPYGILDIYLKPPSGPQSGISTQTIQVQLGLMLGVNPMWQILGIPLPRIGIGYQFAGVVSGWRLVLGDPF